jgi:hypothetical protein
MRADHCPEEFHGGLADRVGPGVGERSRPAGEVPEVDCGQVCDRMPGAQSRCRHLPHDIPRQGQPLQRHAELLLSVTLGVDQCVWRCRAVHHQVARAHNSFAAVLNDEARSADLQTKHQAGRQIIVRQARGPLNLGGIGSDGGDPQRTKVGEHASHDRARYGEVELDRNDPGGHRVHGLGPHAGRRRARVDDLDHGPSPS